MAQFCKNDDPPLRMPLGVKVTLRAYIYEGDDESIEEGEVVHTLGAIVANNSEATMISGRLAKQLGLKPNGTIQAKDPLFNCPPFAVSTSNRPVMVEHELFPGGFGLIDPIIVDNLFWDLILGGASMIPTLLAAICTPAMAMEPAKGPGYSPDTAFMGNIAYINKQDHDRMLQYTSIFVLKFDGASRGNPGHSGGACFLNEYIASRYQPISVWYDADYFGDDKTSNEAEYLALILGLEACLHALNHKGGHLGKSSPLRSTSICVCGDSELVIKQLQGEYAVASANLQPLHRKATILMGLLKASGNRISLCWIPREENVDADSIANEAIDRKLGVDEEEEEFDEDLSPEESLARAHLVYTGDPTLLSLDEIKAGWDSCMNFMLSYGLKPWNDEDVEEALAISRLLKEEGEV